MNDTPKSDKVAVYICHCGGNISDTVDVNELERLAKELPGVSVVHQNTFMCSDPGQQTIIDEVEAGNAERVVVSACAPHLHENTFRRAITRAGMNPYLYEHANIREQVSWVHHTETATDKAFRLIRAAVAKARNLKPLDPIRMDAKRHATVLGGGIAGMKSALEIAKRGIDVLLVEKTPFLGGNVAQLDRLFPTEEKAPELLAGLWKQVSENSRITVMTCTELVAQQGYVGNFELTLKRTKPEGEAVQAKLADAKLGEMVPFVGILAEEPVAEDSEQTLITGSVIVAVGFEHYTPKPSEYGYGDHPEVITLPDLIKVLGTTDQANGGMLTVNGKQIKSMAMIRCVGSRHIPGIDEEDENGKLNEHCSRVCCTATLQADREIKERFPETVIYDFYRDIRAYGRGHEEYYTGASRDGVLFVRWEPDAKPAIGPSSDPDYAVSVTVKDTLLSGGELDVPVDLVVLAVGVAPQEMATLAGAAKIPFAADRFLAEVHPKLRPVETAAAGIMLAGTCQAPMDTGETASAAAAAAAKAATVLSPGFVELDPYVASINTDLCNGTGACVEECPQENCITMVDAGGGKRLASVNPALCTGCGMCVAVCPNLAIEVNGWTLKQYEAMVDAIAAE